MTLVVSICCARTLACRVDTRVDTPSAPVKRVAIVSAWHALACAMNRVLTFSLRQSTSKLSQRFCYLVFTRMLTHGGSVVPRSRHASPCGRQEVLGYRNDRDSY